VFLKAGKARKCTSLWNNYSMCEKHPPIFKKFSAIHCQMEGYIGWDFGDPGYGISIKNTAERLESMY